MTMDASHPDPDRVAPSADLAEYAPIALIDLDSDLNIRAVNLAAESLLGLSRRALAGRPFKECVVEGQELLRLLDYAVETGADASAPDLPLRTTGFSSVSRVTARVRVQRESGPILALSVPLVREREDSVPGVSTFGRILGHEVKNPLAGISGAAQLMLRRARSEDAELLKLIRDETQRIERLLNRLSAFELFSRPHFEPVNIHQLIDRVLVGEEAAFDGRVAFRRRYDPSLPELRVDSDHVHEALQNVVRNAAEAAESARREEGASVEVRTAFETGFALRDRETGGPVQRAVRIDIIDNGPGVDPDRLSSVFEAFASSKSQGRGLGLTIVKEVVTAHHGQIGLDSSDRGTRVSIYLPIQKDKR